MALDRERLLPPGWFINDNNGVSENRDITQNGTSTDLISNGVGSFGSSFSDLSSPFGCELSSTETESEDESIAELARKMADFMFEEDDEEILNGSTEHHSESTLSRIPTAHTFPAFSDNHLQPRAVDFYNLETQPSEEHRVSVGWGIRLEETDLTQQLKKKHLFQHKKSHMAQNRGRRTESVGGSGGSGVSGGGGGGGLGSPSTAGLSLPQGRQLVGSDSSMISVSLGRPVPKSGSSGTGVFLPGGISKLTKKSECSTVLIPARVIQTLQLHFEEMKKNTRSHAKGFTSHLTQQEVGNALDLDVDHHEMNLPQEWTY